VDEEGTSGVARAAAATSTSAGPGAGPRGASPGAGPLREGPLEETSSREDAPEGALGRVAATRTTAPCGNDWGVPWKQG
jgi:hypothetical protein